VHQKSTLHCAEKTGGNRRSINSTWASYLNVDFGLPNALPSRFPRRAISIPQPGHLQPCTMVLRRKNHLTLTIHRPRYRRVLHTQRSGQFNIPPATTRLGLQLWLTMGFTPARQHRAGATVIADVCNSLDLQPSSGEQTPTKNDVGCSRLSIPGWRALTRRRNTVT